MHIPALSTESLNVKSKMMLTKLLVVKMSVRPFQNPANGISRTGLHGVVLVECAKKTPDTQKA